MMMTAYEHGQNAAHSRRYALRDMRPERAERPSMHGLNRDGPPSWSPAEGKSKRRGQITGVLNPQ